MAECVILLEEAAANREYIWHAGVFLVWISVYVDGRCHSNIQSNARTWGPSFAFLKNSHRRWCWGDLHGVITDTLSSLWPQSCQNLGFVSFALILLYAHFFYFTTSPFTAIPSLSYHQIILILLVSKLVCSTNIWDCKCRGTIQINIFVFCLITNFLTIMNTVLHQNHLQ